MRTLEVIALISITAVLSGCLVVADGSSDKPDTGPSENPASEGPEGPEGPEGDPKIEIYELITLEEAGTVSQSETVDLLIPETASSLSVQIRSNVNVATIRGSGHSIFIGSGVTINKLEIESSSSTFFLLGEAINKMEFIGNGNTCALTGAMTINEVVFHSGTLSNRIRQTDT